MAAGVAAGACSIVLNERDLLRIAVFVIVLPLVVVLVSKASQVRIGATRRLVPERLEVGSVGEVRLELSRQGRLPAGQLMVEDGVPPLLGPKPRFVVRHLPAGRPAGLRYQIRPLLRGAHFVGPLRATVTDPFGLCEFERELAGRSRLLVTPWFVPLGRADIGSGLGAGEDGDSRARKGSGQPDVLIRPYRQGDDLRKVHWRSTARRDEIMVRTDESPWKGGSTILIDRRAPAHHGSGPYSSFEWTVSFAASVCVHLNASGHRVRLITEHGSTLAEAGGESAPKDEIPLLDALATVQATHQRDITLGQDPANGQELIAVLGALSSAALQELIRFRPRSVRSRAVLLDVAAWSDRSPALSGERSETTASSTSVHRSAELLSAAGWAVTVVGPETPMPEVWETLCSVSNKTPVLGEMT
jgi:uncharacterized protein (DUF58 family)